MLCLHFAFFPPTVLKLDKDSTTLQNQAREHIHLKQKSKALLVLKLKKYREKEVDNVDSQLLSVLRMIEDIEWEAANMEVMKALRVGTDQLNKMHQEMSAEDVAALLEETNDAILVSLYLYQVISSSFSQKIYITYNYIYPVALF